MSQQRLHSQLAPIDILTRIEMEEVMHKEFDAAIRERYRGIEIQRIPFFPITALATTVQLFTSNDQTPWGPEQGDVWLLRRLIVKSSTLTDTAKYQTYRGSTPSDVANAYTFRFLLDEYVQGVAAPVINQIPLAATGVASYNNNSVGVNQTITGGTVTAIAINGTATGLTSGVFFVPAGGTVTVTYSVAPTTFTTAALTGAIPSGQNVNVGIYMTSETVWLNPGEQVYAQVSGATIGNQYVLEGEAIRCPAEMKGKLVA
jgi:hypothetical protein